MKIDITKVSRQYLDSEINIREYLSSCNQYVYQFAEKQSNLKSSFISNFLWSGITSFRGNDHENNLYTSEIFCLDTNGKKEIADLSKWLESLVSENKAESFTSLLLNQKKSGVFEIIGNDLNSIWRKNEINSIQELKDEWARYKINVNAAQKILNPIIPSIADIERLRPFLLTYTYLAKKIKGSIFYFIIPPSFFIEKFRDLYIVCIQKENKNKWKDFIQLLLHKLFSVDYIKELNRQEKLVESHARKSAISQVMARNMSHNIGSHVLAKLGTIQHIQDIKDETNSQCKNIKSGILDRVNENGNNEPDEKFNSRKVAHCVANFNSYLRARMDYLADIATSTPVLESNKWFFKEVIQGFINNPLLLNHISGIENFKYEIKLFDFGNANCKEEKNNTQNDILLSVPNDILGCHAFYVILENIIRNTAKHGKGVDNNNKTEIKIEIKNCDWDNSLYEVLIYDNHTNDNCEKLKVDLIKKNNDGVLDKKGKLCQGNWGQIEMRCSAAYLRKIPIEEIDDDKYKVEIESNKKTNVKSSSKRPIIEVINQNNCLCYRLFLMKPKNYLIVDDYDIRETRINALVNEGILVLKSNEFNPGKEIYPHQFLLYEQINVVLKKINSNISSLPSRKIKIENDLTKQVGELLNNNKNGNGKSVKDELDEIIWPYWTKYFIQKQNRRIKKVTIAGGLECKNSKLNSSNQIQVENGNSGSEFNALLLNHGENWDKYKNKFRRNENGFVDYAEPLSSKAKSILPNVSPSNSTQLQFKDIRDESKKNKVAEFIISKIGVIDERVQEAKEKLIYHGEQGVKIPYRCIYSMTNILVPDAGEVNLNMQNFIAQEKAKEKTVKEKLEKWFEDNIKNLDALIIHLGILEKVLKGEINNNGETEDKIMTRYIQKKIKNNNQDLILVITSGRGQPHNLPVDERFLNLSSVLDSLVENFSKYKLNNLIFSARKLKK